MSYLTAYDLLTIDQLSGKTDTLPTGLEPVVEAATVWLKATTRMIVFGLIIAESIENDRQN